ncbi:hypothetical protein [Phyllobacterium sp. YR531]|uniref:hypothetical protein n=1 Tax=Phyllobacterium sp. YR531 TaxID=1144343 RepID=UPI00026F86AD|nr:hypothetical protein [Phyllobacterium sp. YR531]EJN06361.1 hypothetical protein PMI41_00426 [Phyllobacterium sp. YR531]
MAGTRASYRGLIRLQGLKKAKAEMRIATINADVLAIAQEDEALFKMQNDRFESGVNIVSSDIIIKRLEANRIKALGLTGQLAIERQELLKNSRTLDVLNDRLRAYENERQRQELAMEIDEHISQLLGKVAS